MRYFSLAISFIIFSFQLGAQHKIENEDDVNEKQVDSFAKIFKEVEDTIKIAVLVYENVVVQDFAGPMEVFSKAKKLTRGKYHIFTVGITHRQISTENDLLKLLPDYSFENMPDADYLVIPGASMPVINQLVKNTTIKDFIIKWNSKQETRTVSICTGSYLLANTGALNNKKATTHYFVADDFSKQFPMIDVVKNVRFVDEGKYITSSGITSGIDAALHIVGNHSGEKIKAMISRALQYTFHEKENWPVAPNGMKYIRKGS